MENDSNSQLGPIILLSSFFWLPKDSDFPGAYFDYRTNIEFPEALFFWLPKEKIPIF